MTKNNGRTPWNKGLTKDTDERVRSYSEQSAKTRVGIKFSTEHKKNLSSSLSGLKKSKEHIANLSGKNHGMWKGDEAGYHAKHCWIRRKYGKANHCENCGLDKIPHGMKTYFEWANISGEYIRNIGDWKQLCKKCHNQMDINLNPRGSEIAASVLKEKDVLQIREMKKKNPTIYNTTIAKLYKVNKSTINRIINRDTWTHI